MIVVASDELSAAAVGAAVAVGATVGAADEGAAVEGGEGQAMEQSTVEPSNEPVNVLSTEPLQPPWLATRTKPLLPLMPV